MRRYGGWKNEPSFLQKLKSYNTSKRMAFLKLKLMAMKVVVNKQLVVEGLPKSLKQEVQHLQEIEDDKKRRNVRKIWKFFTDRTVSIDTKEIMVQCCEVLGYTEKMGTDVMDNIYIRLKKTKVCRKLGFEDDYECVMSYEMDHLDKDMVVEYNYDPDEDNRGFGAEPNDDVKIKDIENMVWWIKM
jgi:hypothetical protein